MNIVIIILILLVTLLSLLSVYMYIKYKNEINSKIDPESEYNKRKKELEEAIVNLQNQLNSNQANKMSEMQNDYSDKKLKLDNDFEQKNQEIFTKIEQIKKNLQYYEDLQKAVVDNFKEQDRIRLERDFYKIDLSDVELSDIVKLRTVAMEISKPVVLYKLIYEIYYKSKFDELFKRLVGDNGEGGIYKIVNIKNEKVYIGRTTDFLKRWRDHVKCGTGSDSGAQIRNRLYEEMKKDGIENFTFEIIDRCDKESQPEREKYWIQYYKSTEFGYNIQSGG